MCWWRPAPTSSSAPTPTCCSGGGYLGSAYVDYGLGNFAFYDNSPPENESGSLVITATGRHIDSATWRPAVIVDDLPQPLTGAAAAAAVAHWEAARGCTDVDRRAVGTDCLGLHRDVTGSGGAVKKLSVDRA